MDKYEALKTYFGYDSFRPGQEALVDAILQKKDAFGIMPTGAGKSLCYQVPALLLSGITLVVSPLISLMQDQVRALIAAGVPAAYFNSSLTLRQYRRALENAVHGQYKIIYVAPERLLTANFLDFTARVEISLVAVDEAHCVSQWGQDFRPSYLMIPTFLEKLPHRPPVAAFTATATEAVQKDVVSLLKLRAPVQVVTGFDRQNLFYEVRRPDRKKDELLHVLSSFSKTDSGIVYCATRSTVEEICSFLTEQGISAAPYHAGLPQETRSANQQAFLFDRVRVIVATNAFGMGIDKPDVRFVIHYNMPKDLESYYQEAGRAGRDGMPAQCILFYDARDLHLNRFFISVSHNQDDADAPLDEEAQERLRARDYARLSKMTGYCMTEGCLRHYILQYFGEESPLSCQNCGNCKRRGREKDMTVDAQKILSCVKRTGERFGTAIIAEVLHGSKTARLERMGLTRNRTYGLLKDLTIPEIRARIERLLVLGCLTRTDSDYPILQLGPHARGVLFENEKVFFYEERRRKRASREEAKAQPAENGELFESLRALRAKIAKKQSVPAYVVFTDATLHALCERLPQTRQALLQVPGMGERKLARYGDAFLACIRAYCEKHPQPAAGSS